MTTRADAGSPSVADLVRSAGLATLGEDPPPEAVEAGLRSLAGLVNGSDQLRRQTVRMAAVDALKAARVPGASKLVDAAFTTPGSDGAGETGQGQTLALADPDPWPDPVVGEPLLSELVRTVGRFLVLPSAAHTAVALWTVHTHAHDAARVSPILAATSPEKRCGKTTLLTVLLGLVRRPLPASNITTAALFRAVEKFRPTLLIDEADTFLREREELRGIINSGHGRSTAVVVRTVGDDHEPRTFSTWAPKAIALIGDLPATLEDRAVVLTLRRRRQDETVDELRLDRLDELEDLRRRAARWAADHHHALAAADPAVPPELHDRARDNWRPLLAIADAAGGEWPQRARAAALELSGQAGDGDAPGVLLLDDLRRLFSERSLDRLASSDLVETLATMEDRPWPEWRRGQPITQRQVARLLKPFDVAPKQMRLGLEKVRGYELADLEDAFSRYLPSEAVQPVQPNNDAENSVFANRYTGGPVPDTESGQKPCATTDVPDVPDETPGMDGPDLFSEVDA